MNSTEIAKLANVSRSTVSRVLNNHPNVSARTRERIETIIQEQNYVPDAAARNLVGKQNKILGLFIIDVADDYDEYTICRSPFFYDYIAYSIDIANRHGYNQLITVVRKENIDDIDRLFRSKSISGGILVGDHLDSAILQDLVGQGYKMVLYNQIEKSCAPNVVVVNYDNFKCGRLAGEELVRRGHTRIAHVTGERDKLSVNERQRGLRAALNSAGLELDETYIENGCFNRVSGGYEAAKRLLRRNRDNLPTAICVGSASMMMGVFQAIKDMGLRVPEDISLISIDGQDLYKYMTPALSEVTTSCEKVAKVTVTRLVELLERGRLEYRDYEISDAELTQRESVLTLK